MTFLNLSLDIYAHESLCIHNVIEIWCDGMTNMDEKWLTNQHMWNYGEL